MEVNIEQRVLIDKEEITRLKIINFVCVIVDENINLIKYIQAKMSKSMDIHYLKQFYYSVIYTYLIRCVIIWSKAK